MNDFSEIKTTLEHSETTYIVQKSKFIANVTPIECEEDAVAFIKKISKKYWDATHNVFAYVIGNNNEIQRFSDDGEPSGTAGLPTLDVLRKDDIKNTAIVVTRYFGGTLLGTGGLVRAYGHSAKEGVISSKIVKKVLYIKTSLKVQYSLSGKIKYYIEKNKGATYILDSIYTEIVEFVILVENQIYDDFSKEITELTGGTCDLEILGNGEYRLKYE